jgi:hypothetical protein
MRIAQAACNFLAVSRVGWSADWMWGLSLIVLTVLIHVSGPGLISHRVGHSNVGRMIGLRHPRVAFVVAVGRNDVVGNLPAGDRSRQSGRSPTAFSALYPTFGPRYCIR